MYRVPLGLDLSKAIGQFTTQICLGRYDIQFALGEVKFAIWSPVTLIRQGVEIGSWVPDEWPHPSFVEIFNVPLAKYCIPNERLTMLHFENGIEMHLRDDSDQYESMSISVTGFPGSCII
jgi:hypothetical protein